MNDVAAMQVVQALGDIIQLGDIGNPATVDVKWM